MTSLIDVWQQHSTKIVHAFWETNVMVFISMSVCLLIALPLGVLLFSLQKEYLIKNRLFYQFLSISLNAIRSVPFIIFIFVLTPLSRALFGSSFGNIPATLPLSLVAISLYTRFVEQALLNVSSLIIQRGLSMGATKIQIIRYFLLPSITGDLILSYTSVIISILAYSTVMGVIGAGGLGEYAFRYGYQEYNFPLMYFILIIFVIYVFFIQTIGYRIAGIYLKEK